MDALVLDCFILLHNTVAQYRRELMLWLPCDTWRVSLNFCARCAFVFEFDMCTFQDLPFLNAFAPFLCSWVYAAHRADSEALNEGNSLANLRVGYKVKSMCLLRLCRASIFNALIVLRLQMSGLSIFHELALQG